MSVCTFDTEAGVVAFPLSHVKMIEQRGRVVFVHHVGDVNKNQATQITYPTAIIAMRNANRIAAQLEKHERNGVSTISVVSWICVGVLVVLVPLTVLGRCPAH